MPEGRLLPVTAVESAAVVEIAAAVVATAVVIPAVAAVVAVPAAVVVALTGVVLVDVDVLLDVLIPAVAEESSTAQQAADRISSQDAAADAQGDLASAGQETLAA